MSAGVGRGVSNRTAWQGASTLLLCWAPDPYGTSSMSTALPVSAGRVMAWLIVGRSRITWIDHSAYPAALYPPAEGGVDAKTGINHPASLSNRTRGGGFTLDLLTVVCHCLP